MTDDALPGFDLEALRHPIWTKPAPVVVGGEHDDLLYIQALQTEIWSSMLPFDGRPYSEGIVWFAEQVWFLTTLEEARKDPYWLAGHVFRVRQEALQRAFIGDHNEWVPPILRLADVYVSTIVIAA